MRIGVFIIFMGMFGTGSSLGAMAQGQTAGNDTSLAIANILPGAGLNQHPFLYCGEWDYIHPQQTMHLIRGGKEVWNYSMPQKVTIAGKTEIQEFGDCTRLSNGNILFSRKTGADLITPDKKIIWSYNAEIGAEVHSIQAIGRNRVLLMQNGNPAKLMLMEVPSGKLIRQIVIPTSHPDKVHGQFRRARMTKSGTYLVAQRSAVQNLATRVIPPTNKMPPMIRPVLKG
jgi:hypothetical protein